MSFEIGKKYKRPSGHFAGPEMTCVAKTDDGRFIGETSLNAVHIMGDDGWWIEVKEPIKHVRYFNIYKGRVGEARTSRESSDLQADNQRIACVRVEFVEGTFDD